MKKVRRLNEAEFDAVTALQCYIAARPKHDNGLCYWLRKISAPDHDEYVPDAPVILGYQLITAAAEALPGYGHLSWSHVTKKEGPVPMRVAFARKALRAILDGRVFNNGGEWRHRKA